MPTYNRNSPRLSSRKLLEEKSGKKHLYVGIGHARWGCMRTYKPNSPRLPSRKLLRKSLGDFLLYVRIEHTPLLLGRAFGLSTLSHLQPLPNSG